MVIKLFQIPQVQATVNIYKVFNGVEEGEILYSSAGTGNSMEEMMQESHDRMKDSAGGSGGGPGGGGM